MLIRAEAETDQAAVHAVHLAAFGNSFEADLVNALRQQARPIVSLVAEVDGAVVGHILFTPVSLPGPPDELIMGLAPMAVVPDEQRKGIGSALVLAGLEQARGLGCTAVVVLGHPDYYPRFGFSPASRYGVMCEYDVPDEVYMALELQPDALRGRAGCVRYHSAFGDA